MNNGMTIMDDHAVGQIDVLISDAIVQLHKRSFTYSELSKIETILKQCRQKVIDSMIESNKKIEADKCNTK